MADYTYVNYTLNVFFPNKDINDAALDESSVPTNTKRSKKLHDYLNEIIREE